MAQHFTHERLTREEQAAPGSERSFAIVMAVGRVRFWAQASARRTSSSA
jgi:hypothetical protein